MNSVYSFLGHTNLFHERLFFGSKRNLTNSTLVILNNLTALACKVGLYNNKVATLLLYLLVMC